MSRCKIKRHAASTNATMFKSHRDREEKKRPLSDTATPSGEQRTLLKHVDQVLDRVGAGLCGKRHPPTAADWLSRRIIPPTAHPQANAHKALC